MFHLSRRARPIGSLIGAALLAALSTAPAQTQSAVMEVTSDTPEYCVRLLDRLREFVRGSPFAPPEVADLSAEGQRMCDQGQTRGGILRLRQAWLLMAHSDEPSAPLPDGARHDVTPRGQ